MYFSSRARAYAYSDRSIVPSHSVLTRSCAPGTASAGGPRRRRRVVCGRPVLGTTSTATAKFVRRSAENRWNDVVGGSGGRRAVERIIRANLFRWHAISVVRRSHGVRPESRQTSHSRLICQPHRRVSVVGRRRLVSPCTQRTSRLNSVKYYDGSGAQRGEFVCKT